MELIEQNGTRRQKFEWKQQTDEHYHIYKKNVSVSVRASALYVYERRQRERWSVKPYCGVCFTEYYIHRECRFPLLSVNRLDSVHNWILTEAGAIYALCISANEKFTTKKCNIPDTNLYTYSIFISITPKYFCEAKQDHRGKNSAASNQKRTCNYSFYTLKIRMELACMT